MTEYLSVYSTRGRLSYLPENTCTVAPSGLFQPRPRRPHRIHIAHVAADYPLSRKKSRSKTAYIFEKLAGNRDSAKRFLRSFKATHGSSADKQVTVTSPRSSTVSTPRPGSSASGESRRTSVRDKMRPNLRPTGGGPVGGAMAQPCLVDSARNTANPSRMGKSMVSSVTNTIPDEKPVASGNGISVGISLAEPVLFLRGFEHAEGAERSTAMLRGSFHLRVTKSTKIKAVELRFRGRATTKWPEGIPPKKTEQEETDTIMAHTWPFFNAQFATAEAGTCADHYEPLKGVGFPNPLAKGRPSLDTSRKESPTSSTNSLTTRDHRKLSLQVNQSRSFGRGESATGGPSVAQKGYRTFYPGDYVYNFELPLDSKLPETIDVELGSVKYELEAIVERAGAFKANLVGNKEVLLIRTPAEGSLEQVEPIAISRNWEDQLHYDIVISGKSFPLGTQVPIAFKLTPLAKVQCHRIKVFVTENIEYWCHQKRVHRVEPTRKVLLFEKKANEAPTSTYGSSSMRILTGGGVPYDLRAAAARGESVPSSDPNNLLGNLEMDTNIGPTEMEFNVQLPSCNDLKDKDRPQKLHFDTTYHNIQVHHWIKVVMRLSKTDQNDSNKRRHFEISIDSPFHILSCRATQANTSLPAYSSPESANDQARVPECGCPGAPVRRTSPTSFVPTLNSLNRSRDRSGSVDGESIQSLGLTRPPTAHIGGPTDHVLQRPIHLLRAPSFEPPAFSEEEPPPPLHTPPPQYESIASPTSGLADYFARLSDAYDEDSEEEERARGRGRVEVPLTPGSRTNRSMDEPRGWMPIGTTIQPRMPPGVSQRTSQ